MFSDYLRLGIDHILDTEAYDHILFVTVLCALYDPSLWKRILVLVTAFTIGHSLTLALSSLDLVQINPSLVETLIPVTIILTGIFNIYSVTISDKHHRMVMFNYILALGFGLIHGLGFSNYFKAILGKEESVVQPLFAFNIGVELGQIVIVSIVMALAFVVLHLLKIQKKYWTIPVSLFSIVVATYLLSK
ncbi:MAG: HupE/UreJ family protein [Saprospiraceae bacterium]|nr:HupE/UreJ family protein [Saprospiraceae bacterium]